MSQVTVKTKSGQSHVFEVEIPEPGETFDNGLMHRKHLAPHAGMLFVYETAVRTMMWMKDTLIPLDMIFIRSDRTIANIVEDTTPLSTETIYSDGPVIAVLELNAGVTRATGIRPGDRVDYESANIK